ncbi:hypothetical protein CT154_07845 [Komagataeibacter xylinus]|nr:hypothetical protein CT154_07845 [Komagataeibacter xylinus]
MSVAPAMTLRPERLVICNHLGPALQAVCANLPYPGIRVVDGNPGKPWQIPEETDILVTGPIEGWQDAPSRPPSSWPGKLRWIQLSSAGVDFYPEWLLDGPPVALARGVSAADIAEYVMLAILRVEKHLDQITLRSRAAWMRHDIGSAAGRVLGIIGFGAVGHQVARRARVFDMQILACRQSAWIEPPPSGVRAVADVRDILARSDHLLLSLPLTSRTRHMMDADMLAHARSGLHIINVSRGGVMDHAALLAGLRSGRIGHATLDVTDPEPLPAGSPLYGREDVLLTPHVAANGRDTQHRFIRKFIENIDLFCKGHPLLDVYDRHRGY